MLDAHREIQALIDKFVEDLGELAKRIAIEQLKTAFGGRAPEVIAAPGKRATRGGRRGQRELEAVRGRLLGLIVDHPGRRVEEINAALGMTTAQIAQPLRQLVSDKLVRTEGARRGTRYFAIENTSADVERTPLADQL